jgi:glutamate N-acetyltransferase / amino-acid N-acetyltransferase
MSVVAVPGFVAGGLASGIKPDAPDLAIVATDDAAPVSAAAVFTTNLACAPPVEVSREHVADGRAAAVVLSSGNANAATGERGRADARRMCELTAAGIGCAPADVLVCSTGLIGFPLPMEALERGIPRLTDALGADEPAGRRAADAILTTDTVRKEAIATASLADGTTITVGGLAKGAAMLAPAMATMLAVLTTDAAVEPDLLHRALELAVTDTFNALLVDGSTSTNDTVAVLANGRAANPPITGKSHEYHALVGALTEVCDALALAMATDAEGATKLARIVVRGARSTEEARRAARAVAGSQLVQCSLYGRDPYWGRVLSEVGASGAFLHQERVSISYNGIIVCRDGVAAPHDEGAIEAAMAGRDIEIVCDLRGGRAEAAVRFTDLTHAYVDENMGTS